MSASVPVHQIVSGEINPTAKVLWSALHNDPFFRALMPNQAQRERVGEWFCATVLGLGVRLGRVSVADGGHGAAVWIAPGNTDFPTMTLLRAGFWKLPFKIGLRGVMRFNRVSELTQSAHKAAVPGAHWYLMFAGVAPESQRSGIGASLVAAGTEAADEAGLPCYLETATEGGKAFFIKQGFNVVYEAPLGEDTIYAMVRQPKRPV